MTVKIDINNIFDTMQSAKLVLLDNIPPADSNIFGLDVSCYAAQVIKRRNITGVVVLFSTSISANISAAHILAERAGIKISKICNGNLIDTEFLSISSAANEMSTLPMLIDDTEHPSVQYISKRIRQIILKHKSVALIVIDNLQNIICSENSDNKADLTNLIKELNIPIVAINLSDQ